MGVDEEAETTGVGGVEEGGGGCCCSELGWVDGRGGGLGRGVETELEEGGGGGVGGWGVGFEVREGGVGGVVVEGCEGVGGG